MVIKQKGRESWVGRSAGPHKNRAVYNSPLRAAVFVLCMQMKGGGGEVPKPERPERIVRFLKKMGESSPRDTEPGLALGNLRVASWDQ